MKYIALKNSSLILNKYILKTCVATRLLFGEEKITSLTVKNLRRELWLENSTNRCDSGLSILVEQIIYVISIKTKDY
jgi:hypothetical protein